MTSPIFQTTKGAMRREISRSFQDLIATSGSLSDPVANASLNLIRSPVLIFGNGNVMVGAELSFYKGGGASIADSARIIDAATPYTALSVSLYGQLNVLQPWSAAPSTNSGFEVHRLFTRRQYDDTIDRAIRDVGRRIMLPAEDYSIILNNRVRNGTFDKWTNGVTSAPDEWTLGGTGASIVRQNIEDLDEHVFQGRYAAALTNQNSEVATLAQTLAGWAFSSNTPVDMSIMVFSATSGRVRVQYTDGVSTFNSDFHNGEGWQELTIPDAAIASAVTDGTITLRIETGSVITAYWGKVRMHFGNTVYEYPLEESFAWLQDVYVEDSVQSGTWNEPLPREWWYVAKDRPTPMLGFIRHYFRPWSGRVLKLVGQRFPSIPGEEENLPINPQYVMARASADLYEQLPKGGADWKGYSEQAAIWRAEAAALERKMRTRVYQGSSAVRDV